MNILAAISMQNNIYIWPPLKGLYKKYNILSTKVYMNLKGDLYKQTIFKFTFTAYPRRLLYNRLLYKIGQDFLDVQ